MHALGSGTVKGSLGASDTPEASADAEIDVDCLKLTNGKYATLPGISFLSDNKAFGVSLWFRANAIITGDGDSSDLTKDLVLLKRKYQGTTEVFGIMIYTTSISEYTVKIKSHNIVYSMNNIVL